MADNKARVHIEVTGDASGADDIGKSLDNVASKADQAGKNVGGGIGASMEKLFPTFTKAGKAAGGFAAKLSGMINPAALATAAVTAAVGAIYAAYKKAQAAEAEFLATAGKGFDATATAIDSFLPKENELATAIAATSTAIADQNAAMQATEAITEKRLQDEIKLIDSSKELALAQIRAREAAGEISAEESASKQANITGASEEDKFAAKAEAANAILEQRRQAYEKIKAQLDEIAAKEAAAIAEAQARDSGSTRDKAAAIDPRLNTALSNANEAQIKNQRDSEATVFSGLKEAAESVRDSSPLDRITGKGLFDAVMAYRDANKAIEEAAERAAEADEEFKDAEAERAEAINRATAESQAEVEAIKAQADALREAATEAALNVAKAQDESSRFGPGGVEYEVAENAKKTRAVTNAPAPANGDETIGFPSSGILAQLPNSADAAKIEAALLDGLQARETRLIQDLAGSITAALGKNETSALAAVQSLLGEIDQLNTAWEDVRNR